MNIYIISRKLFLYIQLLFIILESFLLSKETLYIAVLSLARSLSHRAALNIHASVWYILGIKTFGEKHLDFLTIAQFAH